VYVTDFALTNVRKNCYTFIQNGNEVLPRFLIETAKRLMTSVHGTGVSAFLLQELSVISSAVQF